MWTTFCTTIAAKQCKTNYRVSTDQIPSWYHSTGRWGNQAPSVVIVRQYGWTGFNQPWLSVVVMVVVTIFSHDPNFYHRRRRRRQLLSPCWSTYLGQWAFSPRRQNKIGSSNFRICPENTRRVFFCAHVFLCVCGSLIRDCLCDRNR